MSHGLVLGVAGGATAGIVGAKLDPAVPKGDRFVIGTDGAELTPRFPIS
jgi:hypothetical protein